MCRLGSFSKLSRRLRAREIAALLAGTTSTPFGEALVFKLSCQGRLPEGAAWQVQDRFVAEMQAVMAPKDRARLLGAGPAQS